MAIVRHYIMQAADGQGEALAAALTALAHQVRSLPGCVGVECLIELGAADCFVFIERWESVEAHKAAGPMLPKSAMSAVMSALLDRPVGRYLTAVHGVGA